MENIKEAIKYIMVGAVVIAELDSGSIGPGSSPRWGHCDTLSHEVTVGKKKTQFLQCLSPLGSGKMSGQLDNTGGYKARRGELPYKNDRGACHCY